MLTSRYATILLLLVGLPCTTGHAGNLPRAFRSGAYGVRVLQNGRVAPVKKGGALLRKAPFVLELTLPGKGRGILLNASASAVIYQRAKAGQRLLDGPPLGPGSGMAEAVLNKARELWLSASGSHYLYYQSATDHRFSSVTLKAGRVIGRRGVAKLADLDAKTGTQPLAQWRGKDLYLVLLASSYGKAGAEERWRQTLHLRFR